MHGLSIEREVRTIELEELANLKSEILEVREQEQPPRTMWELYSRIWELGDQWRKENSYIVNGSNLSFYTQPVQYC
ncbi:DNA primase [Streptococcus pneumoniae]|nr:DNA primase [Streptococcus pneumoniae]